MILLDLVMSGMNGPQFLKEPRKTHPDLPVVIVTGYPHSRLVEQATQYVPLLLLCKPAAPVQLECTVGMVMDRKVAARRRG